MSARRYSRLRHLSSANMSVTLALRSCLANTHLAAVRWIISIWCVSCAVWGDHTGHVLPVVVQMLCTPGFLWQLTLPRGSSVETWGLHKKRFLHYRTGSSIAGPWRRWLPGTWCVQPFPVWCRIWCNWIWLVFWLLWPWGVCTCLGGTPSDFSGSIPPVYWGPVGGARHLWVRPLLYKWWYHQQTIWCLSWCQYQCHWWTVKTEWGWGQSLEVPQRWLGCCPRRSPLQPLVGSGLSGSPQSSWGFCLVYRICWALWGASNVTPCQRPCWSPSQCNQTARGPKALCGGHDQSQWAGCHKTGPPWSRVAQGWGYPSLSDVLIWLTMMCSNIFEQMQVRETGQ